MKVVVCGGSGFLGSHVADALTERGYDVTIFDRQPSAHATPTQRMVVGDILDGEAAAQVFQGCDYVYHFAGLADLDDAAVTSVETVEQNVRGTVILLEAARNAGVKRFVYASTVYVYSHLGGFYRCSKQAGELYVEEYHRRYGLDYTILRHGTLYGPRASQQDCLHRIKRGCARIPPCARRRTAERRDSLGRISEPAHHHYRPPSHEGGRPPQHDSRNPSSRCDHYLHQYPERRALRRDPLFLLAKGWEQAGEQLLHRYGAGVARVPARDLRPPAV